MVDTPFVHTSSVCSLLNAETEMHCEPLYHVMQSEESIAGGLCLDVHTYVRLIRSFCAAYVLIHLFGTRIHIRPTNPDYVLLYNPELHSPVNFKKLSPFLPNPLQFPDIHFMDLIHVTVVHLTILRLHNFDWPPHDDI